MLYYNNFYSPINDRSRQQKRKREQSKTSISHNNVLKYVFKPPTLYLTLSCKTQHANYIKHIIANQKYKIAIIGTVYGVPFLFKNKEKVNFVDKKG